MIITVDRYPVYDDEVGIRILQEKYDGPIDNAITIGQSAIKEDMRTVYENDDKYHHYAPPQLGDFVKARLNPNLTMDTGYKMQYMMYGRIWVLKFKDEENFVPQVEATGTPYDDGNTLDPRLDESDALVLTHGEELVRLSFNPSGSTTVDGIKARAAEFIDYVHECVGDTEELEIAMRHAQTASLFAVAAVTKGK